MRVHTSAIFAILLDNSFFCNYHAQNTVFKSNILVQCISGIVFKENGLFF